MSNGIISIPMPDGCLRHSSVLESIYSLQSPAGTTMFPARGSSVAENRNRVLSHAKATNASWVFFMDDDMMLRPDTLMRLLAHPQYPVISALYVSRVRPHIPFAFNSGDVDGTVDKAYLTNESGLQRVHAVGAGCMLIRPIVWETMKSPWFTLGQIKKDAWCDDTHFCKQVRDANLGIYCDYDTTAGHLSTVNFMPKRVDGQWYTAMYQNGREVLMPAEVAYKEVRNDNGS